MHAKHNPISDSSLLIVGLVRNCASQVAQDIDKLALAFSGAKSLKWLLIESDSTDNTVKILNELSKKDNNLYFVTLGELREMQPLRTDRIATCRNKYVSEIRENPIYRDVDYVVVSDFDGLNSHINKDAVKSCWDRDEWDICTANQDGPYYDIWALRHPLWSPNDCLQQYRFYNKFSSEKKEKNLYNAVYSRAITIPRHSDWIEVDSAFGGLAIYPKKAFEDSSYIGITPSGQEICEHVLFHKLLREKGYHIAINPKLINAGVTEHVSHLILSFRVKKKLKNAVRMIIGQSIITHLKTILKAIITFSNGRQ